MDLTGLSIVPPRPSISVSARARADSQPRRMAAHPRQISVECAQISKHPCMAREYMGIAYIYAIECLDVYGKMDAIFFWT